MVTDNNPKSPHFGRTYVAWDQVRCADPQCNAITQQPVDVTHSDDGGRTWSKAKDAVNIRPGLAHQEVGVQPVVLPNGHVVIVYADALPGAYTFAGQYKAIRSTDGGRTWSKPKLITNAEPFAEENNHLRAPNIPSAAVTGGGKIWVAYQDQRFGSGRNDIVMQHSSDEGKTWSTPINATTNEMGIDHFSPA